MLFYYIHSDNIQTVDKNTSTRYLRQYQTNNVVKGKRCKRKQRKLGGRKEEYHLTKKAAIRAVYNAKQHTQSEYFREINTKNDRNKIFKMAW